MASLSMSSQMRFNRLGLDGVAAASVAGTGTAAVAANAAAEAVTVVGWDSSVD
ncbi:MAG: hypothetical protein ACRD17_12800 [Terriglobales bacterium]